LEKIIFKNATKDEARSIKTRKETFKGETKGKRERNFEMEIKMNFRNSLKKKNPKGKRNPNETLDTRKKQTN